MNYGDNEKEMRQAVMSDLRDHFKPEFLNRVDDIVIFHNLGIEQLKRIIDVQLSNLKRMLDDRKIHLELAPSAKELIARDGFDQQYGARPMKRAIQTMIQNPLAVKLLEGEIVPGEKVIVEGDLDRGEMRFITHPDAAAKSN
jgi:ATP-dependent Clp protease ATP-binding subunit ClpB